MCMFCRSLFVLLYFWPLCWLSFFDLRILITLLVSSNSSPLIKSVSFSIYRAHIYILSSCMLRMPLSERSVLNNIPWCIIFILLFYSSTQNGVNSFKFVDTYFRGFLKKCIFMDTDVRLSPAIVSICVHGDNYSLNF
jgi:hypothetical protein